ncbi:gp436 family protein [Paraburkholderia sp.]|uniref:gp436 family protein n=1 Tax=Paraburkholderia sp. TaxID=1926495 RepID=UPI003D6DF967
MSYATTADVQARYLERDLISLTDETNQAVDMTRLQAALDDASAEIDGYLCVRYVLPLVDIDLGTPVPVPTLLVRACCDIAVYGLQTLRPKDDVEDARRRYDGWIRMLRLMSTGDVQINAKLLPGQATFPPDVSQSPGMTEFTSLRHPDTFGRRHR